MMRRIRFGERALALGTAVGLVLLGLGGAAAGRETSAKDLLKLAGADVGFCVHLGCGREKTADLTADLAANSRMLVHGLALDDASLERARKAIEAKDLSGRAMVEKVPVNPLPYLRDLANLVVIEDFDVLAAGGLTRAEVDRIVAPGGVVCIQKGSRWTRTVKARPREMDDWTHPFHGADGNRVSSDRFVQFPVGLRWQDGVPMNFNLWAACRAWVIANGRCFTLSTSEYENIGPASFSKHKMEEYLTARDAFNGLPLWKVNCETTNDGKGLNFRNVGALVADNQRVYAYKKDRLAAFDAATGQVAVTYPVRYPTVRLVLSEGVIVSSGWEAVECKGLWDPWVVKTDAGAVEAFDAASGKPLWSLPSAGQQVLASEGAAVVVLQPAAPAKEQTLVAVDLRTGKERWRVPQARLGPEPDLQLTVIGCGIVGVAQPKAKIISILSAANGDPLWEIKPADRFWTPLVSGRLCWGDKQYDPRTGQVKGKLPGGLDSPGCTPACIVGDVVTASRGCGYNDMSLTDLANAKGTKGIQFAGARGACLQGAVPAHGMFYTAQNFCRCAPGQVPGFVAFGPSGLAPAPADFEQARPVEKGPAFGAVQDQEPISPSSDWPMFLHDPSRSGMAPIPLPEKLKVLWQSPVAHPPEGPLAEAWRARLAPCVTAPVVVGSKVYAAAVEGGQVIALDAATGKPAWRWTAGGRVDSAPTIHGGLCLFGSHDGYVYALRAKDGQLAWRARAAPAERRMVAFGQVESVWPAPGSVVVHENTLYATAGRTSEADGGVAVLALNPATGQQAWARQVGPGPQRQNDILALRDGKLAVHHIQLDPKSGAVDPASKPGKGGLEGINDGTWTRIGTRRSGGLVFGKITAELLAWNDDKVFGYESGPRTCFALARDVAQTKEKLEPKDYAWRLSMPPNHQVEAMALCYGGLVLAGRVCDEKSPGGRGFLWVISAEDSKKIAEVPLEAPPVYNGVAVAAGQLYVSLQNGNLVCLGKAD